MNENKLLLIYKVGQNYLSILKWGGKMSIKIFDYSSSKLQLMNKIDKLILEQNILDYYFDTDWLNGPSIVINFRSIESEMDIFKKIQEIVSEYKRNNPLSNTEILRKMKKYEKEQKRLTDLELRNTKEVEMKEDGTVLIENKTKSGIYNSPFHENRFLEYRYQLQPIHSKIQKLLPTMDEKKIMHFFIEQFKYISLFFNGEIKDGYISYVSHVIGFFSRLKLENKNYDLKGYFDSLYSNLYKETLIFTLEESLVLEEWKKRWAEVNLQMIMDIPFYKESDTKYLNLEDQYEHFINNISELNSPFHNLLLRKDNLKEFILSDQMLHYRNVVNLFYVTLPLFEQNMLKKHFYGYCVIKDVQKDYEDLLIRI